MSIPAARRVRIELCSSPPQPAPDSSQPVSQPQLATAEEIDPVQAEEHGGISPPA